jgi:hypothetical protein
MSLVACGNVPTNPAPYGKRQLGDVSSIQYIWNVAYKRSEAMARSTKMIIAVSKRPVKLVVVSCDHDREYETTHTTPPRCLGMLVSSATWSVWMQISTVQRDVLT